MLTAAKGLMSKLWQLSPGLRVWLAVLITVNGILPLWFLDRVEAWVAMGVLHGGFLIGVVLFQRQGLTRLLGLMHAPWILLLVLLWPQMDQVPASEPFGLWIRVAFTLDAIALVFDAKDVLKYLAGDHAPVR